MATPIAGRKTIGRRLLEAVDALDAAEERSGAHCSRCQAATSLAALEAREVVIFNVRELVSEYREALELLEE